MSSLGGSAEFAASAQPSAGSERADPAVQGRPEHRGRRAFLRGLGLAALGTLAACGTREVSGTALPDAVSGNRGEAGVGDAVAADSAEPVTRVDTVYSAARGQPVDLSITVPPSVPVGANLPVVLYLHGRDGDAGNAAPPQTFQALARQHAAGTIPAFAYVAVDGGFNTYWTFDHEGGDLMAMLADELPGWLRERALGDESGLPFACAGLSMGGFGALNYARDRNAAGRPLTACGLVSPAIPLDWAKMASKQVFPDESAWRAADPLPHLAEIGPVPLGLWVGDHDENLAVCQAIAERHSNTPVFSVVPGGHGPDVFDTTGEPLARFLGEQLDESP